MFSTLTKAISTKILPTSSSRTGTTSLRLFSSTAVNSAPNSSGNEALAENLWHHITKTQAPNSKVVATLIQEGAPVNNIFGYLEEGNQELHIRDITQQLLTKINETTKPYNEIEEFAYNNRKNGLSECLKAIDDATTKTNDGKLKDNESDTEKFVFNRPEIEPSKSTISANI